MELLLRVVAGATLGAAAGFTAHRVIGCRGGGCPLTGSRWTAMLLWGLLGIYAATTA